MSNVIVSNIMDILKCKETIKDVYGLSVLFIKGKEYEFVKIENRFTKQHNFVGYIKKDEEGNKRWITKEFKDSYFEVK